MRELLTTKQVARAIGVSEASLKRWCDKGMLAASKTAGGHRRIPLAGVVEFLRRTNRPVVRPELIGLPATTGQSEGTIHRALERLRTALESGDEAAVRGILFDLYLAGHALETLCDQVVAEAFEQIGHRWETGSCAIYQERRACEISLRALYYLSAALPTPPGDGPLALGGTPECDWYGQATAMAELVLRQCGWRAESLGCGLPFSTLAQAVRDRRPRLMWVSVSIEPADPEFLPAYDALFEACQAVDAALVVGGRGLTEPWRRQMRYTAYCDTMAHLVTLIRTFHPSPTLPAQADT